MDRNADIALYSFDFQFMFDICLGSGFDTETQQMLKVMQNYFHNNGVMLNKDADILRKYFEQCYDYTPEKYHPFSADSDLINRAIQSELDETESKSTYIGLKNLDQIT